MFHDQDDPQTRIIQSRIQQQLDDLGKTPEGLLRDWATLLLKDELGILENGDMLSLLRSQYDNFDRLDTEVVIAVPPGRTNIAHSQVLEAFIQPPLTSASVSLESEPAAMFRSWVEAGQDTQDWVVGKRYLAADGGGRTCCFVRFHLDRLNPLGFTQEFASETQAWYVEQKQFRIARGVPTNFKSRDWEISRMRNDFELKYKQHVGRGVLLDLVFKRSEVGMSFLGSLKSFSDEAESCFDSCVAKLILRMLRQLDKGKSGEPADYFVLGGGLFHSKYVLNAMGRVFDAWKIRQLSKEKEHVAISCVLSRINGDFFTLQGEPQYTEKLTLIEHRDIDRVRTGCTDSSSMKAPMLCELCTHNLSGLRDSQAIVFGYKVCGCMCIVFVKDLSPIIDIYLPSPSIKKTHGRQTSRQGACVAKLSISRASHPVEEAGNAPL
ncbi:hypothetical protein DL95DRAFT_507873 [Leptodontidium sp. 2 PMI_412]|nr:hypothetical protein DL95DRAFT_507873 [Leptodontidium sp. 2 PMI_412]